MRPIESILSPTLVIRLLCNANKDYDIFFTGHFGCVYEGMFIQDGEDLHVAVKSLLHGATNDISNFLREGIMMKDFKHPHVLRLIGVCIKDARIPLVVLPFMKHGDLLTYIRNPQNVS